LLVDVDGTVAAAGNLVFSATFARWLHSHAARLEWRQEDPARTDAAD
jgi:hypothetical protein